MCHSDRYTTLYLSVLLVVLLAVQAITAHAKPIDQTRRQLLENQRNIVYLRKEKRLFQKELQQAIRQQKHSDNPAALQVDIDDIKDSIAIADELISNISALVSQQRLLLTTLERGTPPTALDIALNKALNSNLSELTKSLANNESARKEVAKLRALLKQQARLGAPEPAVGNTVINADKQQQAEGELLRLLSLFSNDTADNAEDKIVQISGTTNNKPFTEDGILSYLGHNQYHMETTVYSGKMTFTVDGRPWQLNVSPKENQATYVLIYDAGNRIEPRLVMFNKALLLE